MWMERAVRRTTTLLKHVVCRRSMQMSLREYTAGIIGNYLCYSWLHTAARQFCGAHTIFSYATMSYKTQNKPLYQVGNNSPMVAGDCFT